MSISTILIGKSESERDEKILEIINDSKFSLKNNPDLLIIEKTKNKKSIGIEEVREIGKFLKILPISHSQKIVIIKDANLLTTEAQNSLLKILEEPPEYSRIILEGQSEEKILPTIISRCQIIKTSTQNTQNEESIKFLEMSLDEKFIWAENSSKLEKEEILRILNSILKEIKDSEKKVPISSVNLLLEVVDNLAKYNLNTRLTLEYLSLNFEKKEN